MRIKRDLNSNMVYYPEGLLCLVTQKSEKSPSSTRNFFQKKLRILARIESFIESSDPSRMPILNRPEKNVL